MRFWTKGSRRNCVGLAGFARVVAGSYRVGRPVKSPERYMELHRADIYENRETT